MQIIRTRRRYHARMKSTDKMQGTALAAMAVSLLHTPVQALEFSVGAVEGRFDSTFSVGASWRVQDQKSDLIAQANGGTGSTKTTDDGNQNFKKGETFSKTFKGVHDLQLSYENVGVFTRGKYWYDFELKDETVHHGHGANGYQPGTGLNDDGFSDFAKFSGAEILDAFVYGRFDLGDVATDLRLGRQVLSWGESTFIQGGINSVNPLDVSAFRRPGAEVKEGLLPVNMAYGSFALTDTVSLETFYLLEWTKTEVDGCGTYFSTNDFVPVGCPFVTVGPVNDQTALAAGLYASRADDIEPDDGQYGVAVRWYAEALNETEFGFYHINYHSRLPIASAVRATNTAPNILIPGSAGNPQYLAEYPEDIRLYGVSFSTTVGSTSLAGEVSYRENLPVQINGPEILNGALAEAPFSTFTPNIQAVSPGEVAHGYDRFEVYQAQLTAIQFFEQVMGASRLALVGEIGMTHVAGLPDQSEQRYGRNSGYGIGYFEPLAPGLTCETIANKENTANCTTDGYVTSTSWGYRVRGSLTYNDVLAGINFIPKFAWSHDVSGYGPGPGAQFEEGRIAASLGLDMEYLNAYRVGVSYTGFTGGDYNTIRDRDFVSLTASVAL